ncbi:LexA family transcriptional regulator [Vitreoscilla stercoraria]|uniref:Helix-turn-helix transcriptional regulator n=1 Tax=Vitreoscilla stercoraria TaxID=61 RepID=A0ABY4EDJ6_VITST|nr:helix-turn-helix transcriptional regulator [Vitreoscilla stercoraria]UOO93366.1 helix-turn-helix transcriptional regulator [Vitreoscilla stercoraria]
MENLKDWVKTARKNAKLTQEQLAEKLELTKAAVSAYETGRNAPSVALVNKISKITNTTPPLNQIKKNESNATLIGGIEVWDKNTPLNEDEVEVPFYKEVYLSAGNGFTSDIEDHNGYKLRFSKSTLKKYGICYENVVCVSADGDSMKPVFPDGATLGIDTGNKSIKDGQIYAINHDGLLRTKILKKRPGNKILIQSYNSEEYPDDEVSLDEINVIGRVFWWSVMI